MLNYDEPDKVYPVPKEMISCPACGQRYGHHNTKVCKNCEECSKCCMCEEQKFVPAKQFIEDWLKSEEGR